VRKKEICEKKASNGMDGLTGVRAQHNRGKRHEVKNGGLLESSAQKEV